jgi:hypothetical protein
MAINYDDYVIHIKKSGQKLKKFKCSCDACGNDRGYLPKAKAFTVCHPCKMSQPEYRATLVRTIRVVRSTEESRMKTVQQMNKTHGETRIKKQQDRELKKANPNWWRTDGWKLKISVSVAKNPSRWNAGITPTLEQRVKQSCSIRGLSIEEFNGFSKDGVQSKLAHALRCRMRLFLKKNKTDKAGSAVCDLGCSVGQFKSYLESKLEPWMTWDNYGRLSKNRKTWNIDHIQPLTNFDLSDREQFKVACHYTNLQPMSAYENSVIKSDKI